MKNNKIDWHEDQWNPITGCTQISKGCSNCYAKEIAENMQKIGYSKYSNGFKLKLHPQLLNKTFGVVKRQRIFVNSMSDLFHENIPFDFISQVFKVIVSNPRQLFLIVTKRAEQLNKLHKELPWPRNLLMAVTVEHSDYKYRIKLLQETGAVHKVVFFEPLLNEIGAVDLTGINWAFVGGESGKGFRPVQKEWIYSIKEQCDNQGCTFVFKQWGGYPRWKNGNQLDGKYYHDIPTVENCLINSKISENESR